MSRTKCRLKERASITKYCARAVKLTLSTSFLRAPKVRIMPSQANTFELAAHLSHVIVTLRNIRTLLPISYDEENIKQSANNSFYLNIYIEECYESRESTEKYFIR